MARENFARAFLALGDGLGQIAEHRAKLEFAELQQLREESLMRLQHQNRMTEVTAAASFDAANETRRQEFETNADSAQRDFMRGENEANRQHQSLLSQRELEALTSRNDRTEGTQEERWAREDRRAVESVMNDRVVALNERLMAVVDNKREAQAQLADASILAEMDEELSEIRSQLKRVRLEGLVQLKDMGDPRYKDSPEPELMITAGFTREEIEEGFAALSQGQGAPNPEPARQEEARQIEGSAAMSGPANPMPQSPVPAQDLSKAGRGRTLLPPPPVSDGGTRLPSLDELRRAGGGRGLVAPTVRTPWKPSQDRTGGGF